MLVLSRMKHEQIVISDDIIVTVRGFLDNNTVQLGILARSGAPIDVCREEMADRTSALPQESHSTEPEIISDDLRPGRPDLEKHSGQYEGEIIDVALRSIFDTDKPPEGALERVRRKLWSDAAALHSASDVLSAAGRLADSPTGPQVAAEHRLTRRTNESIVINQDIIITVVAVRPGKVRLGIEAPKEVPVHRAEVHDAIERAKNSP